MRRLTLKKETLADLTSDELGGVVGGTMPTKFDCTESHQVCVQLTRTMCAYTFSVCLVTRVGCPPTYTC